MWRKPCGVMLSDDVPSGAVKRLTEHFGSDVADWLTTARALVLQAADLWNVALSGFHDAGWTSIVGVGTGTDGRTVILKATPDRDRFQREQSALTHWKSAGAVELVAADDARQVLLLRAVGPVPGGARQPANHEECVAAALARLHHDKAGHLAGVPLLTDYYRSEVLVRIERRARSLDHPIAPSVIDAVMTLCGKFSADEGGRSLLHSDLYAENVLFDEAGAPVFIDPLAHVGDMAFDWAFWSVYYTSLEGFERRLGLCKAYAPCPITRISQWAATLAADGALFYIETEDERAREMLRILSTDTIGDVLRRA